MKPDRRGPTSPAMPQAPDEVRISIVTVCFNAVATIERTLLSVAGQSHPLVEHLVIDGGSTDGTLEILMPWSSRLAHCVSGPDRGLYDAMNRGLALMRGQLVCMLNADDWFFRRMFVLRLLNAMLSWLHPGELANRIILPSTATS